MSNYVESIIEKLLTPDTNVIKQATKQLMEYFVSEKCFYGLFEVLSNSKNAQVRVCAATLLRKKVKNWKTINDNQRSGYKIQVLNVLVKEQEEAVRKQIMWLIANSYKYIVKSNQEWPELLKFINDLLTSTVTEQTLSGTFMLSILNEESAEQMKPHFVNILRIFQKILIESTDMKTCFYVISSLRSMIPYTSEQEANDINNILPNALLKSIAVVKADEKEETVTTIFDFFQTLVEYDLPIVTSYIKTITDIILEKFILDSSLKKSTRVCAMNLLNVLIETQKNNLVKNDLIRPIVNAVFLIMCQSNDPLQIKSDIDLESNDFDDEDEKFDEENENIFTAATQVLDYCAIYFPPKKFIKILIEYVSPAITSESASNRKAVLAALAITAEGCSEYYRNHYLELLTDLCIKGMQDSDNKVVQLSYFALCQFSEFLQPDLNQFAKRIMNILFESMDSKVQLRSVSRLTIRFYDALESFCESLDQDLIPFVPTLMSKLMTMETICSSSLKIKRYILSIFSSIVCSIKNEFTPYFDYVVQLMKPYLLYNQMQGEQSDTKLLQIESIDLMGIMAKHIGKEKFNDVIIENCLSFVKNVLNHDQDPEIRSAAYDLLAGLASKLRHNLPLNQLLPKLIETLKSEEGINIIDQNNKKKDSFSPFDEIDLQNEDDICSDEDNEDEAEEEDNGDHLIEDNDYLYTESDKLMIDNEFVAEKLSAIYCLEEILKYPNQQFFNFYSELFSELKILTNFLHLDVRSESFIALSNLISYYYENQIGLNLKDQNQMDKCLTLNRYLNEFYSKSVKVVRKEANRKLVMSVLDAIKLLLNNCSSYFKLNLNIFGKQIETYAKIVTDTFQHKIYCQEIAKEQDSDEDEAECYKMLKEYAGDILPSLALCLPDVMFDPFFEKTLAHLLNMTIKSDSTNAELSFVIGVIGETVSNMESVKQERAKQLLNEFYKYLTSKDDEIRSNTIFTIGVIFYKSSSNNSLHEFYPKAIQDLMNLAKTEQNKQSCDNICGSLCCLLLCCLTNGIQNIDYQMIFKMIFIDLTPLKVDFNEYFTLFTLISQSISMITDYYPRLIELSGHILLHHQYESKKGTRDLIVQFLSYLNQNFKQEFDGFVNQFKEDIRNEINIALTV